MLGGVGAALATYAMSIGVTADQLQLMFQITQATGAMLDTDVSQYISSDTLGVVFEWVGFVGGLFMLVAANGLSALEKVSKADTVSSSEEEKSALDKEEDRYNN